VNLQPVLKEHTRELAFVPSTNAHISTELIATDNKAEDEKSFL
jgi:hypothetical protein